MLPLMLAGCAKEETDEQKLAASAVSNTSTRSGPARQEPKPPPEPVLPDPPRKPQTEAEKNLQQQINQLGRQFDGKVGIAVRDVQSGWTAAYNGREWFPQQSVSKLWVSLTALDQVDKGKLNLSKEVTVERKDLAVFFQPIRTLVLRDGGYETTLDDLMERAITRSDNTANDFLLWRTGGPHAVQDTLADKNIKGIRFGPGERLMQSSIAGLEWKPEYSIGSAFWDARDKVPLDQRREAFEDYIADPVDGATPVGMVNALARLKQGKLLSSESTEKMLDILHETRSGPRRLKGGVPGGWKIGHKTGTGQVLEGEQAGYNDVGIVTAPSGNSYAVAVLIGRTSVPLPQRMDMMQRTVRAVVNYERQID
ncbi:class A beta-lactamase [Altericroceibacterium xinjiangense]|uniref:class A beta-lactamase n=1 Tax=Altericroceibacterium xinjiangense TaxID=762261 RepID=UPI001F4999ED|nr:class A beta-lactamase [Altericroceibacterium xinjiangense]